ncbi:MAG: hypothetical protein R8G01_15555 [Ilumatobacteraceae bacterium]|nr:hypothetical protein [Ilumatobacteraceae bacterium]
MATFRDVPRDKGAIARVQSLVRAADLALSSYTSSTQTTIKDDHMADTGTTSRRDRGSQTGSAVRSRSIDAPRRDLGATFIEVLVSVVLLGTVGIAVLTALQATIVGARVHDRVAQSQALLAEAADLATDTEPEALPYVDCDSNPQASYQAVLTTLFPPPQSVTVSVANWDRTAGAGGAFVAGCRYAQGDRLQQLTISTVVDGTVKEVVVVKRPNDVPTADTVPAPPVPPFSGGSGQATVSPTPGINGP